MRIAVLAFIVCAGTTGCAIESSLVECGDQLCPVGSLCVSGGCATQQQVDVCAGMADGSPCSIATIVGGTCHDGACRSSRCGNGAIDLDEVCDDGNQTYGDGCSGDCRSLELCGNGIVDRAVGEQCDDGNVDEGDGCRTNCTIPICGDGIADVQHGEGCDRGAENSDAPGAACRPNCQPAHCGDAVVDPGEVCDDGNLTSGDGCSGDCRSLEVCGNDIVDALEGEQCDTGVPGLSGDGCTSICTAEFQVWRDVSPKLPIARFGQAMATAFSGVVMNGGASTATQLDDTYLFDGAAWSPRLQSPHPSARRFAAMGYDSKRHKTILYGGQAAVPTLFGDTWEFDGTVWHQLSPAVSPPPRRFGEMAYDALHDRLIMFGGLDPSNAYVGETWAWDGTTWMQLFPAQSPQPRFGHALAYDPVRQRIVLFGGSGTVAYNDTWEWDGTTWNPIVPTTSPASRTGHRMAWDGQRVMLFGGSPSTPSETWGYDGTTWTNLLPSTQPANRTGAGMAYDPVRGRVVLNGGSTAAGTVNDTWEWDGTSWRMNNPALPGAGVGAMAYEPRRGVDVRYDGTNVRTWEWDGWTWRWRASLNDPSTRTDFSVAHRTASSETVLFGGFRVTAPLGDTWVWNGTDWIQRFPATSPPATSAAAMAYDEARDRVVLFGGMGPSGITATTDIWEWDGVTWALRTPATKPASLRWPAMAYDPIRHIIVVFGGMGPSNTVKADTWEWDGTSWTNVVTAVSPPGRRGAVFAYDARLQKLVLHGGQSDTTYLNDTWAYDGTRWIQLQPVIVPTTDRVLASGAFDVTGSFVLFGGTAAGNVLLADTWRLRYESNAVPVELCMGATDDRDGDGRAGCADPDCWLRCAPSCAPGTLCDPTAAHCGDGTCDAIEDPQLCPQDCPLP